MKKRMGESVYIGCQLCGIERLFDSVQAAHDDGWYVGKNSDLCPQHARLMKAQMGLDKVPDPPKDWKDG